MERKTFFVYTASQTARLLTARPLSLYPSLITKAAAVLCDLVIILMSCNTDFCT